MYNLSEMRQKCPGSIPLIQDILFHIILIQAASFLSQGR